MATEILRPTGAGDETNIDNIVGGESTHWESVNSLNDTTYLTQTPTADATDLYAMGDSAVGTGTINKVTIYLRVMTTNEFGSGKVRTRIKTGGSEFESGDLEYTSAEGWHYETFEHAVNPDTTNAWEWAEIDALQVGLHAYYFETKGFQIGTCSEVYFEVDYDAPSTQGIGGGPYVY